MSLLRIRRAVCSGDVDGASSACSWGVTRMDELTQGAVKENEEKHMNGTVQETILPGVEIGATVENGEEPLTDKKQKSAKWGPRSWRKQSF